MVWLSRASGADELSVGHRSDSFAEPIGIGMETFHALKKVLRTKGYSIVVGDEGGFAPDLKSNEEAVDLILQAITKAGLRPSEDISICLDPASSEMGDNGKREQHGIWFV
jgi:enolase